MTQTESKDLVRVVLEGNSKLAYDEMVKQLKAENQFIRLTPSKLVSWIVVQFQKAYFEQDKKQMVHQHLNSKEYLKDAIKNAASKEDLEKALKDALEQMGQSTPEIQLKSRRGRKPKNRDEETKSSQELDSNNEALVA